MCLKWTQHPEFSHVAPRLFIATVRAAAGGRRQSSALGRRPAIICVLSVDRVWTQEIWHGAGRFEHSYCLACSREPPSIGTAHHRLCCCSAFDAVPRELPLEWQHVAASACESDTLRTRGLVADPSVHWQFVAQPEVAFSAPPGPPAHSVVYSGDVFTDGSKIGRCNVSVGVG